MTVLDDPLGATASELSEELIFLIASVSTDDQRKYATELFRHYTRRIEAEAFLRGRESMAVPQLPQPALRLESDAPAIQPTELASEEAAIRLIPHVRWQD